MTARCKHCNRTPGTRVRRKLCGRCYHDPGIRQQYPLAYTRGSSASLAKLTEADVLEIRKKYATVEKYSQNGLVRQWARQHGVNESTIYYAISGRSWWHIS